MQLMQHCAELLLGLVCGWGEAGWGWGCDGHTAPARLVLFVVNTLGTRCA